jgi:CHAT domain-containing protein
MFMRRALLFLFLMLSTLYSTRGQGRGNGRVNNGPAYLGWYREAERLYSSEKATAGTDSLALSYYERVILFLESGSVNDSLLFDSYLKSGIIDMSGGSTRAAIAYFLRSVSLVRVAGHLPDSLLFKPYLYAGSCYYDLLDLDSSSHYYRLAERLLESHPDLAESERLYNKSGVLYYESGDYPRSIQYFRKALALVEKKPSGVYFIVNYKNNIASSYLKMQEYDQAIDMYKSLLPYHIHENEIFYNIGSTYLDAGKPAEAIRYLRRAGPQGQAMHNNLARAWIMLKEYDSAAYHVRIALSGPRDKHSLSKSQDLGVALKYAGDLQMAENSPAKALGYYQRSIIQLDQDFNDTATGQNPGAFNGLHNSFLLFDALVAKAAAFRSLGNLHKDTALLFKAFLAYSAALTLARHAERTFSTDEAKLFLVRKVGDSYQEAVDLGFQLYGLEHDPVWLQRIFGYMEEIKASVLQAGLGAAGQGQAPAEGKIRDMLAQEKMWITTVTKLNLMLSSATDSLASLQILAKIRDLEIRISGLQEKLDDHPEYYRSKFNSRRVGISDIQKNILAGDGALLSYYYSRDKLYCFYITGEEYGCLASTRDEELPKNIQALRLQLSAGAQADRKGTENISRYLFQRLIAPVYQKIKGKNRLIIIPYNEIAFIPFEMLSGSGEGELLVKDFGVSYDYSANFLLPEERPSFRKYEVLAVAPFASAGGGLPALTGSAGEVSGLPGEILLGEQATKAHFLKYLTQYPIVHLATHAVVNDEEAIGNFIEFYRAGPGEADTLHRLFEQEVYHLNMDSTALVILSACETGSGRLIGGEGIISLSRAFSYAGCKSVITSLWKADDAATAFIIKRVHFYLRRGDPKDQALRKAKLEYLEDPGIETRYKTPAYWSHLILVGDFQAVARKSGWGWLIALCSLFLFLLLIILPSVLRKSRARKSVPGRSPRI